MANYSGQVGTFNRTVGVKQAVDDVVAMISPYDTPIQSWLPKKTTDAIKYEWFDEDLQSQAVTWVSKTGSGPWVVTMSADDVLMLRVGDILHVRNGVYGLQFKVTALTSSTTVTVAGHAGNSTSAADGDVVEIIGQDLVEGSDPLAARTNERSTNYNYTQIYQEKVEVTRTKRAQAMLASTGDPYDHEVMKKMRELKIRKERNVIFGSRTQTLASGLRTAGGLFSFISTNSRSGNAAAVKTTVNNIMRDVYTQADIGADGLVLFVSPAVKVAISSNWDATLRRWDTGATNASTGVVDRIGTDFGALTVVVNRHLPTTKGFLLRREFLADVAFSNGAWFHELLSKTGDGEKGEIVGEYTLEVKAEKAHGIITVTDAA